MKVICPKNKKHKTFLTVAHVMQEWKVNEHGELIDIMDDCLEVTHRPDTGNIWTCTTCGEFAKIEES